MTTFNNHHSFFILIMFIGTTIISSCGGDECTPQSLSTSSLEAEYGCTNTKHQMDIALSNDFTVIRSQNVFDELVSGSCTPEIDFDRYSLIIGKQGLTNGNTSIDYDWKDECEDNFTLMVTFQNNITAEAPNLTYHALVNALQDNARVTVEVTIIQ